MNISLRGLKTKRMILSAGILVFLVVAVLVTISVLRSDSTTEKLRPLFEAQRGPLSITVSVSGTIKAMDREVLTSEIEGQTTILYIIPEGEHVKQGDLLVELDASKLQDQLVDQEIRIQNAEASFIKAREDLEVVKSQAESDIEKAKLNYQFAQEDLQKYTAGDFPLKSKKAEADVTLAKGDMNRALEKVEGSRRLAERNFITKIELEADEQAALKARLDKEMAEEQLKLLHEFEYKRNLTQLQSAVEEARKALERTERKAKADVVQAEAQFRARQLELDREKSKGDKLREQISKAKIYAPRDGLVVYATTGQSSRRGSTEPLAEGQTVRERQELIYLPTTDSYKAEVKVHESSLAKVSVGLPVRLVVDALPGKTFEGTVEYIAPLPDAQSVWMNPDLKVYNTDIKIIGSTEGLRTGMSCRGEILVKEYQDVVYVPVQCVVKESGEPTVYVMNGQKVERRKVKLGLDNNRMACIEEGLKEGEMVLLAPPLAADELRGASQGGAGGEWANFGKTVNGQSAPQETGGTPSRQVGETTPSSPPGESPAPPEAGTPKVDQPRQEGAPSLNVDDLRERFRNATPEERAKMRQEMEQRLQNMSPEERQQLMERMQRSRGGRPPRREQQEPTE